MIINVKHIYEIHTTRDMVSIVNYHELYVYKCLLIKTYHVMVLLFNNNIMPIVLFYQKLLAVFKVGRIYIYITTNFLRC